MSRVRSVAVVGAGVAGLTFAARVAALAPHLSVRIFEKSRGPSGRIASRRADVDGVGEVALDHGAQYFTARTDEFKEQVREWIDDGVVRKWEPRLGVFDVTTRKAAPGDAAAATAPGDTFKEDRRGRGLPLSIAFSQTSTAIDRFVGVPRNSALGRHLARALAVSYGTRVDHVRRAGADRCWTLVSDKEETLGTFDAVVMTAPAPQTAALLESAMPAWSAEVSAVDFIPCWAVMVALAPSASTAWPFDGAFVNFSPLSWICRNSAKPERGTAGETWMLHANNEWAKEHVEMDAADVQRTLLAEARALLRARAAEHGDDAAEPLADADIAYTSVHRWRYAAPNEPSPRPYFFDADAGLGVCGDWCGGPRVEGAFTSGMRLAEAFAGAFGQNTCL